MPRLFLLAALALSAGGASAQSFEALGGRDGTTYWGFSAIRDFSYDGETLLGITFLPDGSRNPTPAILDGGTVERLDVLDGRFPSKLSGDGQHVAGHYGTTGCTVTSNPLNNCSAPFVYDRDTGGLTELTLPAFGVRRTQEVRGLEVSEDGSIVVATVLVTNHAQVDGNTRSQFDHWTFRWTDGSREEIDHVVDFSDNASAPGLLYVGGLSADGRVIVGIGFNGSTGVIARYANGGLTYSGTLPPYSSTSVSPRDALSADGAYAFGYASGRGVGRPLQEAVRWNGGTLEPLGFAELGGSRISNTSKGTSRDGSAALICESNLGPGGLVDYDIIWTAGGGARGMIDLFQNDYGLDLSAFEFELDDCQASKMRGDRVIVGTARINDGPNPGGFAAWRARLAPASPEITVNVTGDDSDLDVMDGVCDSDANMPGDQCTLRAAIEMANVQAGRDSVVFDIPGDAPHTIAVPRSLPVIAQPLAIDAMTQPGYAGRPLVRLQGAGQAAGLVFSGGDSAVRGLSIGGFSGAGVTVQGSGDNSVEACWVGIAPDGSTDIGNGAGVVVNGSPDNVIGSTEAARLNLIGYNDGFGIQVTGAGATGNRVIRNVVGMTLSGTTLAANDSVAVLVSGGAQNTIVGTATEGNRIAGTRGIELRDLGSGAGAPDNSVVQGNVLGLTSDGSAVLGEMERGITVTGPAPSRGVSGVSIGGDESGQGNRVVVGNGRAVWVSGARSGGTAIARNTLGLLADGTLARTEREGVGIFVTRANQTVVLSNVVGGFAVGIALASDENIVTDNKIGVDATGEEARPNERGLWIPGAYVTAAGPADVGDRNVIGGDVPNVVSGNRQNGIIIGGALDLTATANTSGDFSGAVRSRAVSLGSSRESATAERRPAITGANQNTIGLNRIGTNAAGTAEIGNGRADTILESFTGVEINVGTGNRVLGNLISGNGAGIQVQPQEGEVTQGTIIAGNVIGGSMTDGETIPNQYGGIEVEDATGTRIVAAPIVAGGPAVPNRIVGNKTYGVRLVSGEDTQIRQNLFEGNEEEAIFHFPGTDFADRPQVLSAAATPGAATIKLEVSEAGVVEIHVSPDCAGGYADGTHIESVPVSSAGQGTVTIGYATLPGGTPSGSIGTYLGLTLTPDASGSTTSEFADCVRITSPADAVEAEVASGQTGPVLDGAELEVEITETTSGLARRSGGSATLAASVYRALAPQPSGVDGSATSASGMTITPSAVSSDRYWTLRAVGSGETTFLDEVTYDVCLEVEGVRGVADASQLVVLHRADAGQPWTPYDSSLDGARLCAVDLTAWGDLGIGADSLVNPVPSERLPEAPEALALRVFPNPASGATAVEVATPEAGPARVTVHDALGREVAMLYDGSLPAGVHTFTLDTSRLAPGVYVLRVEGASFAEAQTLTVVR